MVKKNTKKSEKDTIEKKEKGTVKEKQKDSEEVQQQVAKDDLNIIEDDLKKDIKNIKVEEITDSETEDDIENDVKKHKKSDSKTTKKSKDDDDKDDGSLDILKYILIGGAIIILLFVTFMIFQSHKNTAEIEKYATYNEFEFEKQDMLWKTEAQLGGTVYQLLFRYHPNDLEDIPINGTLGFLNKYDYMYVAFDPNTHNKYVTLSNLEIIFPLKLNFQKTPRAGVVIDEQKYIEAGASYVTCANTTEPVIILNNADVPPSVVIVGNCITINGKDENLVRASDRLVYKMFNIMS